MSAQSAHQWRAVLFEVNVISESVFDVVWRSSGATSGPERVFVLVDHAGCSGLLARLSQSTSLRWSSLFQDSTESSAIEVAPILIDLGSPDIPASGGKRLLAWLSEACSSSNAVLVMRSTRAHEELSASLKRRLDALLPDDMPVLLRYFDSRVFVSLMQTFDAQQKAAFCCIASQWLWLDRGGKLREMITREETEDVLHDPITFSVAQQAQLIKSCEADAVAQEVVRTAPDLCSGLSRGQLHELVSACLPAAHRHGITSLLMQSLFCMVALEHGVSFHEQASWLDGLTAARTQGQDFAWVVQQVERSLA